MKIEFTENAATDLDDITTYISIHDSTSKAKKLAQKIEKICLSLSNMPKRSHTVKELHGLTREFLEIISPPYRIIYKIKEKAVYIHAILDGRRDLQDLLQERLLKF